ncbi:MerR family transcriptional regulator [Cellulomonas sp. A375-1]|uniref:MerR family transcriptional regulator n=1 Tax=Cellulomonas gelida TaxID=1712 RepID=A0A4Y3KLB1_9CELL|nr:MULTISPECIES: MerR family transcriptional regulator [Cellulomonas]KMM46381.1 MerR family transcriptional regulator [Cellulomonas sp. A375-1]GEA84767.1 MerR family transcriptional regulator [Cellulomonas gelida]GGL28679.1 MerR family transcriptional regulator [Cellulomonas gelida]
MEASIQEVARLAGTTSRTLRHYDAVGLLPPSRVTAGGYRWYDDAALVRLQRILLLRELGLGLAEIGRVLDREQDEVVALRRHLAWLRDEQRRLERLVASVERTITAREEGGPVMAEEMFDGFDHTQYKDEVEQRWGADAYATSDAWWRGMPDDEKTGWQARTAQLAADWAAAAAAGTDPASDEAHALAARHVAWLTSVPGTPGHGTGAPVDYVLGLAELYVADERFGASYGGPQGAAFVRAALQAWAASR